MSRTIVLDSSVAGLISNPAQSPVVVACTRWSISLLAHGVRMILPEIADYEVRRELLRAKKTRGLAHLDALGNRLEYLSITTAAMRRR